jgi:exodeoxyribonuclease V beta subunit
MHKLVNWFNRPDSYSGDQDQLRLESDKHLVQIVTMHSAKGLEYDVVMIPVACYGNKPHSKNKPVLFHQQAPTGIETILDLSTSEENLVAANAEVMAEDMRLLYVAITRARYLCFLGLTLYKSAEKTAFARLLQIESTSPDSTPSTQDLLSRLPESLFEINEQVRVGHTTYGQTTEAIEFQRPPMPPSVSANWRIHSYTSLSRQVQRLENSVSHEEPGFGDDDSKPEETISTLPQEFSRFTFPRGPKIGVALHDLLEVVDFQAKQKGLQDSCRRLMTKIGLHEDIEDHLSVMTKWIENILATPFSQDKNPNFALRDIVPSKRLNEMEFFFPVKLDKYFLQALHYEGYLPENSKPNIAQLEGMMIGFIDLVVQFDNKFYLIDYKSNHLGLNDESYSQENLQAAISHHQYDLQYLIYHVALVRYLESRIPDFDFDTHIGGVCYLFLRGMSGLPGAGVFIDKPSESFIQKLDALLTRFGGFQ